jgi:NADPH-dependent curcumin reductase CurA
MRNNGRVCVCGSISEYDDKWAGQTQWNMILMRRLTVSGFICMDHMNEFGEATTELSQLVKEGRIKYGTLAPPNTFIRNGLMRSTGTPKTFA